ncbi:Rv3654c family TadE-like protein [Streptomyces sp. P6-2-1]|uniref:Rv3654c family TadE-like protein n=1 Tax=unclassified Streptomyces TaxID=2593676 RepID=UPI003D367F12
MSFVSRARRAWAGDGRDAGDRGAATVWAVAVLATLGVLFSGVLAYGQVVLARHRAAQVADLGALAAADTWARGTEAACGAARRVAGAQGGRLAECGLRGRYADVTSVGTVGPWTVRVRARAGPPVAAQGPGWSPPEEKPLPGSP